jgi:hypothetical protein
LGLPGDVTNTGAGDKFGPKTGFRAIRCQRCGALRPPCRCTATSRRTFNPVAEIMPDRCTREYERTVAKMGPLYLTAGHGRSWRSFCCSARAPDCGSYGGHVKALVKYQGCSFEVLLAQISNDDGKQVVFASVPAEANSQTRQLCAMLHGLIAKRSAWTGCETPATPVTVLSDGADGAQSLVKPPALVQLSICWTWLHLAMRIQHATVASIWSTTQPMDAR